MGKGRKRVWLWRGVAALLLAAMLGAAWLWWEARSWRPDSAAFPVQGALIGERDGAVRFGALRGAGAKFVYLEASHGAGERDSLLGHNLEQVARAALPHGVVHAYDPCIPAELQAANFVTIVPRDARLLPPAIALDVGENGCADPVSEAAVESELMTFINQVENHAGQPVVLKVSPAFEARYGVASRIERNLWLEQDWFQPDYAGRPWTLWTANAQLTVEAADDPVRWVVVQP